MSALSLSSNEFCILNLLWSESRAMTRPEILEALPDKDWNPNSIHLILNNMIKKGVLQVVGVARCGRGYGRTYAPTLSQTEYAAAQALEATPDMTVSDRLLGVSLLWSIKRESMPKPLPSWSKCWRKNAKS